MGSANGCCRDPKVDNNVNTKPNRSGNPAGGSSPAVKVPQTANSKEQEKPRETKVEGKVNSSFQPDNPPPPVPVSEPPVETSVEVVTGEDNLVEKGPTVVEDSDSLGTSVDEKNSELDNIEEVEEDEMSGIGALQIQKPAPQFAGTAVVDGEFKDIKLSDYKGKYVVFFFYPLDFTFVCPTEIIAFSEAAEKFREINCEVIAASTDSHFSHLAWVQTPRKQGGLGAMNIPLLADKTGEVAKKYGVYKEDEGIAFRGLFIIDGKQNLRQITINDLPVGRSVEETLRLVQAFQFTDVHGEVCPAGWKPGDKTIKPSVNESKSFFEST